MPEEGVETFFGSYDENLRNLEALFKVRIRTDGHELVVEGEPSQLEKVETVVGQFASLLREGYRFGKGEVKSAAQLVSQDPGVDLREYFLKRPVRPSSKRQVVPKSPNQRTYLDAIEQHDIVFGVGPAGTGKTYLAMAQAVSFLVNKRVTRIILARPAVEAGEKLGFLPGDLQEKVNPYLRPLYDALYDMLDAERVERLLERGVIEVAPIAFMRGRTLAHAFIIVDEAQNTSRLQMKMVLTRLGEGARMVVTGDPSQIDLLNPRDSGLGHALRILDGVEGVGMLKFEASDVVRHAMVERIVRAYDADASKQRPRADLEDPDR